LDRARHDRHVLALDRIAVLLADLDAERARLFGDRLRVVVRGIVVDVERGRMTAELVEPRIELHDEVAARASEAFGDRDLRELGPHPDAPRDGALEHVAAQLAPP